MIELIRASSLVGGEKCCPTAWSEDQAEAPEPSQFDAGSWRKAEKDGMPWTVERGGSCEDAVVEVEPDRL
jgi:hypothetical protein